MNINLDTATLTDRQLIERHLDGDRDAFRQIVERHQAMVCALGLSACGEVTRSEDLAQEVFIVAWKQLPELRDPEKLRGWLAGITRNLINNSFRRQQRIPTNRAEELSVQLPDDGDSPREQAISADEASLMWQALADIPENYREPMVLFYREQQSVTAVAGTLEISEEAVRQRLVRGRAMLTDRVAKLVEETLKRSAPTPLFAGAVMLALHMGAIPTGAKAAVVVAGAQAGSGGAAIKVAAASGGLAAAASKGGLATKGLAVVGFLPALFSGITGFLRFRAEYDGRGSDVERRVIAASHIAPCLYVAVATIFMTPFTLAPFILRHWGFSLTSISSAAWVAWIGLALLAIVSVWRWQRRSEKAASRALEYDLDVGPYRTSKVFEYRSQRKLLGLPLLHVNVGGSTGALRRTARGWIAICDGSAFGGFFAIGGQLAIAPISFAACAIGLLGFGVIGIGVAAVGSLVVGVFSYGGIYAFGGYAAQGTYLAMAGEYAQGLDATAAHANDALAVTFFSQHLFFAAASTACALVMATLCFLWLPPLLLIGLYLWRKRVTR